MKFPILYKSTLLAGALSASLLSDKSQAIDTQSYLLSKGQHFVQTNTGVPVLTGEKPFDFYSLVEPTVRGSVTNASLQLPSSTTRGMSNLLDVFEFERSFATKAQLDAAFPEGRYRFIIDGTADGRKTPALDLKTPTYPPVPRVLNFTDLQGTEADQNLDLAWAPFTGGTTNDYVVLEISENGSDERVFSTSGLLDSEVLKGTSSSLTIPANTLSYDQAYTGRLLFVKRSMLNTNGYPGAIGISGYFRDTEFPLATLSTPPAAGRIQFSSSAYRTVESNGVAEVTITRSGSQGQVSVNLLTFGGNANDGEDYLGLDSVITFDDGVSSTNIAINVNDDATLEGNETFQMALRFPTGGAIVGERSNSVVTIVDNEKAGAGKLEFTAPRYIVTEQSGIATLTVKRTGGSTGVVTARFSTSEETATSHLDYFATNGIVRFGPGVTSKTITIRLRDDKLDEPNERFSVFLSDATGGAALGETTAGAAVVITDNDVAGVVSLSASTFKARENAGTLVVTAKRTGGAAGGVTVDYTTGDDTAQNSSDYQGTGGTLTFAANETTKTFAVTINQDLLAEGNERFFVQLNNPSGGATLGAVASASAVIVDDESSLSFGQASYLRSETNTALVIPVLRSGDLGTPVSISFATANGTALAGSDYRATNGVLNFPTNIPSRNIVIPVIRDHVIEDDENLFLNLFNPQGGTQLGAITETSITITNDDAYGRFVFSAPTFSTTEGTAASVVVKRVGGTAVGTSVTLQTIAGGTAIAGTDYRTVTTNITFAGGETSKTVRIPTIIDIVPEGNETVKLRLSNPTGGATLGNVTNATLTLVNKPDPNAIPAAGPTYMSVTITGVNGNPVNKTLNVVNNPVAQETVSAAYNTSIKAIQGLTGSKTTVVLNGFFPTTTFHVLQLPFFKASSPGVFPINPEESSGGAIWTYNTFGGESHNYGTGNAGSSGNVIIDVLDPVSRIIAGRFDFVAVKDGGTAKVRISGSFRVTNVTVN